MNLQHDFVFSVILSYESKGDMVVPISHTLYLIHLPNKWLIRLLLKLVLSEIRDMPVCISCSLISRMHEPRSRLHHLHDMFALSTLGAFLLEIYLLTLKIHYPILVMGDTSK